MPPTPAPPGARGSLSWRTRHGGPSSSRRARTTPRPRPTTRRASGAPTRAWCGGCRGRERGRGRRDPVYYLTILHFFFQLKRHGWDERGSMSRPVRGSVPPARAAWTAPSSMDDAVVGETEEEDGPAPCADTLQDSRSGHLWTPPTPAHPGTRGSLSWRTRREGPSSSPSTPPARELRGASPCCWISWVGGVRRDGRRPGGGPLPSPGRFELKGLDWSEPGD